MIREVSLDDACLKRKGRSYGVIKMSAENQLREFLESGYAACEVEIPESCRSAKSFVVATRGIIERLGVDGVSAILRNGRVFLVGESGKDA